MHLNLYRVKEFYVMEKCHMEMSIKFKEISYIFQISLLNLMPLLDLINHQLFNKFLNKSKLKIME